MVVLRHTSCTVELDSTVVDHHPHTLGLHHGSMSVILSPCLVFVDRSLLVIYGGWMGGGSRIRYSIANMAFNSLSG